MKWGWPFDCVCLSSLVKSSQIYLCSIFITTGVVCPAGLFETLPGRVQCEMLLKATEQCFNTLEKAEMLLLLLKRFPESVVQHGVSYNSLTLVC